MMEYPGLQKISKKVAQVFCYLAFITFATSALAGPEPVPVYEDHFSIGAGASYSSAAFEGLNGYATPMPFFSFRWGNLFGYNQHDQPTIGWELFQHKRIILAVAATRGRTFLDISEINLDKDFLYWGLEDRDQAIEAGFLFRYFSHVGLFEAKVFHDVVSAYGGTRSTISISRPFPDTGNWSVVPRLFINHYSEKFNKYYFGITAEETEAALVIARAERNPTDAAIYASQTRPTYVPGNSAHYGVDLSLEYNFTESLKGIGYIGIETFTGPTETSALIEDKELVTTSLGIRYAF
jgi:outer membrane scaffolding protein for murein synthesis (MipA/OmpV family)